MKSRFLNQRAFAFLQIAALVLASMVPFMTGPARVDAAQVTTRSIDINTSEAGASTSYQFQFTVADQTVQSFRVEFCDSDPLPNTQCDADGIGDDIPDLDSASLNGSPTFGGTAVTLDAVTASDHYLDFSMASGVAASSTTFDVTVDNILNPDNTTDGTDNNQFYARIYVYTSASAPAGSVLGGAVSPTTAQVHEGGIAMSTADQITVSARVQENLEFCVGTAVDFTQSAALLSCTDVTGNTIDLGVLSATSITESSNLNTADGDCEFDSDTITEAECAMLMISTNATASGVIVDYISEAFDVGTTCAGAAPASTTDQCLNTVGSTETALVAGTEAWGIRVDTGAIRTQGTTTNITVTEVEAAYDGASSGHAVVDDPTVSTKIFGTDAGATAADKVVDREQIPIEIAATSGFTTPSGLYQTTLTFVATGTF